MLRLLRSQDLWSVVGKDGFVKKEKDGLVKKERHSTHLSP